MKTYSEELASLPTDWKVAPLASLGSIIGGSTPSRAVPRYWGGTIPWVSPGELTALKSTYLYETREKITPDGLASCGTRVLPAHSLLVTTRATIGSVALTATPTATNQGFKSIVFDSAVPGFYYYAIGRIKRELERRSSGTTFLEISTADFANSRIAVPQILEQRQIAEILQAVDESLRRTEQLVEKLKLAKQGLLHDLLTRGIDDNGELRDPICHPEQFKASPFFGAIPATWSSLSLAAATTMPICYGVVQPGAYCPHGTLLLTIGDLNGDYSTGLHRIEPALDEKYSRSRVLPGDLLLSIKGTVGKVGIVPDGFKGNISRDLARFRFASASPAFAQCYFTSPRGRRQLEAAIVGTTRAELSIRVLTKITVPFPSYAEQLEIADRCSEIERAINENLGSVAKLRLLKLALMDDLLTGRVRVTPLLEKDSAP